MARRMTSRLRVLIGVAVLPLVLFALLPLASSGSPGLGKIGSKIDHKKAQIQWRKGRERVLSTDVAGYTQKINALQGDINTLQSKQVALQVNLDNKRAELAGIQADLRAERLRLARLRARLAEARKALATRLVDMYKADQPDMVTVVLESNGFADLLDRTEFMQRVSHQDARIIGIVVTAKADATATAKRLDGLEVRAAAVTKQIEDDVNQVTAVKGQLVDRQTRFSTARSAKTTLLSSTRADRQSLEGDLHILVAEQAKIESQLRAAATQSPGSNVSGPVRQGSGGLIWPVNGPIVSPFGMRWGRLHAGVDIAVPTGTPVHAAQSGRVAIAGWVSGYGNYTCIQHSGSLSTCYGHQSSIGVSVGQSVSQGQVIGLSGCTGHCFGPHVHFETRINGTPVDPMGYL
jgi:murein DD-endopeptidase MepM/ murein hydrolase activator NlpD